MVPPGSLLGFFVVGDDVPCQGGQFFDGRFQFLLFLRGQFPGTKFGHQGFQFGNTGRIRRVPVGRFLVFYRFGGLLGFMLLLVGRLLFLHGSNAFL